MSRAITRAALLGAAAYFVWVALSDPIKAISRPAELLTDSRARSSWTRPDTLAEGETLDGLLRRGGLNDTATREILGAARALSLDPRRLRAQMPVEFTGDSAGGAPTSITMKLAVDRLLHIERDNTGAWRAREEVMPWTTDTVVVRGAVPAGGSLWTAFSSLAGQLFPGRARNELVGEVARVYAHRVEMSTELRAGDSVQALVERAYGPEGLTQVRNVLAARLFVGGRPIEAFNWPGTSRTARFFDSAGRSLVATFLRTPLDFPRITSVFSTSRRHPILNTWRAHRGMDYGAASGTPVYAVAEGTVVSAVYNPGGYGNMVEIRHINGLSTRYAHLRGFARGIRVGARVAQREVVGYVGATGLATAPHLHFEVLDRGVQRDPRYALPRTDGKPLPSTEMPAFSQLRTQLTSMLRQSEGVVRLAQIR